MKMKLKQINLALAVTVSVAATAMPLSDYNLILFNDYNFEGGDVEGKTLIGGSLEATGYGAVFGSKAIRFEDTLTVVGDINATNLNIENGDVVYGGTMNVGNLNMNGGGSVRQDTGLNISSIKTELELATLNYSALDQNGYFDPFSTTLTYDGLDTTAVFNVDAMDIFAMNNSLRLNSGVAETVIINVSGTSIAAGGGANLIDGFRHSDIGAENILWNFHEAEVIDFNNLAMFGSILATGADITGGAVFDGSVAANSYTGGREFHEFLFDEPTVEVSEPATIGLFGLGLMALFRRRLR
jgi:choice-of-anchor A domain-containing protein